MHERLISIIKSKGKSGANPFVEMDCFGLNPGFKISGGDRFKTKFGCVVSTVWFVLICSAFYYYLSIFFDKSRPMIQYNRYRSDQYMHRDIVEDDFHYWFRAKNSKELLHLSPTDFFKNFSLHGVLSTHVQDEDPNDTGNKIRTDYIDAQHINFIPCSQAKWVQQLIKDKNDASSDYTIYHSSRFEFDLKIIEKQGICLDSDSMHFFRHQAATRSMHINLRLCGEPNLLSPVYAPHTPAPADPWASGCTKVIGNYFIFILFGAKQGGAQELGLKPPQLTNLMILAAIKLIKIIDPTDLVLEVNLYDNSIDIYDFFYPLKKFTRYTTKINPTKNSQINTDIVMNDIEFRTNRGFYFKDYQEDKGIEIQEIRNDRTSRVETATSNPPYWTIELSAGDSHLEVERNYKGVFYVFAGVGGMSRGK